MMPKIGQRNVRELIAARCPGASWRQTDALSGDELVGAKPFDAIEIELAALWEC